MTHGEAALDLHGDAARDPRSLLDEARRFLAGALAASCERGRTLVVAMEVPQAPLDALLRAFPRGAHPTELLFDPPSGPGVAGVGAALRIELDGADRFRALRERAAPLFARIVVRAQPRCTPPPPRLFGGFAFAPGGAGEGSWRGVGDGAFALPRWTLSREGARAWLAFASTAEALAPAAARARALDELGRIDRVLRDPSGEPTRRVDHDLVPARVAHLALPRWRALVEAARADIRGGFFRKIVVARASVVDADRPLDAIAILGRLAASAPGCARFAFRDGDATFLGATPERLVALSGRRLRTEALAGSIAAPAGAGEAERAERAARLLASEKDREEHRLVVDEIARRLGPRCAGLAVAPRPRVRALRHVLHLHTPVEGELSAPAHVLDLVEALHPTPAVAGLPTADAIAWIARHEPSPRGWYAGPVGWFDAAGDGEFVVALRAGLIAGRRALLYAGAGIVRDSDPDSEHAETEVKQRALLDVLGVHIVDTRCSGDEASPEVRQ